MPSRHLPALVVFPLLPILPDGTCPCSRGAACKAVGKHPAVKEWQKLRLGDAVPLPAEGAGSAIVTGAPSSLVVIDVDGPEAAARWAELNGGTAPVTFTVRTGRLDGGTQYYFRHPGFHVSNSTGEIAPHIDVRGDGGLAVIPGSPHKSGRRYEVAADVPLADLPDWLKAWFRSRPSAEVFESPDDVTEGPEYERRRRIYADYLAKDAPARGPERRGRGDVTLFEVVQYGAYDLALPAEDVFELIAEHYDPRCSPPWGDELEERVMHKCKSAKTGSTRPRKTPMSAEEEEMLGDVFEPTSLASEPEPDNNDPDCGFKVQWGGWGVTPRPPSYLVDRVIPLSKVSMIFAEPGTIKTWLAISLAAAVSSGKRWLDEYDVKAGRVLYVDFEDGVSEFHRRVHLLTDGEDRPELGYTYSPGRVDDTEVWKRLTEVARRRDVKFVVIDTMAAGTPGIDENDRNAADALGWAGKFTEETDGTVLVLHHANRAGEIRGTSAFKASVDSLFKLETLSDEDGVHKVKLSCTKSGQKKTPPVHIEFSDGGMARFDPPEPEPKEGAADKAPKKSFEEVQAAVLLVIGQYGPIASKEKVRALVGAADATVRAAMRELEEAGDIVRLADGWQVDNDEARRRRLVAAITARPSATRSKLLETAAVPAAFFDRLVEEKTIRARGSNQNETPGFFVVSNPISH